MRIYPILNYKQQNQKPLGYQSLPEQLSFEARVDKSMDRFYSTNETRMPQTVVDYVATLEDKTKFTPLETQQSAFELLKIADSAEDIKGAYPDEELFKTLIDPQKSKARRGIVKLYNDFAQDLHAENKDILKSKENFTVYLVKKIFLENKTIDEINHDLETDLDPDFRELFHTGAGKDARYVHPTTLSTLGIQVPQSEYRQSLRYTREGYSDLVGGKISEAQKKIWENLPEEEKNKRTQKLIEATNEPMTDAQKEKLQVKMTERWKGMSAAERTDYISRMKSGSESQRYAMIEAWNNSMDLIKALSSHLRENNILKPADMLYSDQEFSQFQSEVMSDFWAKHPDFAAQLGDRIQIANEKVSASIANGTFEELKTQILDNKSLRIKELEAFKNIQKATPEIIPPKNYMEEFREAYLAQPQAAAQMKNMPPAYIEDYFKGVGEGYDRASIEAWTKNLRGERINPAEMELLIQIRHSEPAAATRMNRAIEAALANVLYECTNNPEVFRFSHSDCKTAIAQIARGEKEIHIISQKENTEFQMPLVKRKIDKTKIANLYHAYKTDLGEDEVYRIARSFFATSHGDMSALEEYISGYGKSANIIFSDRSVFPNSVKERFYRKFKSNMPAEISENFSCLFDRFSDPFGRETRIKKINFLLSKRFDFVPTILMEKYQDIMGRYLRTSGTQSTFEEFENHVCVKRATPKSNARLALIHKDEVPAGHALRLIAGEQILAEALYDATKNPEVFAMQFEELCDNIELFNMIKKFPSESRTYHSPSLDREITLTATSKLNLKSIKDEYLACTNDVTDLWLNSEVKTTGTGKFKTLLEILANGENNSKILEAITKRIKSYKLRLI